MNFNINFEQAKIFQDSLPPEDDQGSIEYKYHLVNLEPVRLSKRLTQLKYRMLQPPVGQATYYIGVLDDGQSIGINQEYLLKSLQTFNQLVQQASVTINSLQIYRSRETTINSKYTMSSVPIRYIAVVKLSSKNRPQFTKHLAQQIATEPATNSNNSISAYATRPMRICISGNVDSGKSTLIGVLTTGVIDNSRGLARSKVFNYQHEQESGRTSSIAHHLMAFDDQGAIVNYQISNFNKRKWPQAVNKALKTISLLDLAGHRKYLNTTIKGISGMLPDYTIITVGANSGINQITQEHLILSIAHKIPIIFVITKIDIAPPQILQKTLTQVKRLVKRLGLGHVPLVVYSQEDLEQQVTSYFYSDYLVPIFLVNNTDAKDPGRALLAKMLFKLPVRVDYRPYIKDPVKYTIHESFKVNGIGDVINGILYRGTIHQGQSLYVGPINGNKFLPVTIRSIQQHRTNQQSIVAGNHCCLALRAKVPIKYRPGMIVTSEASLKVTNTFTAKINLTKSTSTHIKVGYQPVIHINNVKQTAEIIEIYQQTNTALHVQMRLTNSPTYIESGIRFIVREGGIHGIGVIL